MNSKKLKRQLTAAVVMVLVAVLALSSATFAWFSMNTKVTATNVTIEATTSKNLLITKTSANADDYSSTTDLDIENLELVPTSTIGGDVATPTFFKLSTVGTHMTQDSAARGSDTTFTTATANTDYVKTTVWLKCVGEDTTNLKATITTTDGGEADLDPAIRVMLVDRTNNKTFIYSPVSGASYLTAGQAVTGTDNAQAAVLGTITTAATSSSVLLDSMTKDTAYQFDVYAWYEGEDAACKATNTLDLTSYQFSIEFTVT